MISYKNNNVKEIGDMFLSHNRTLKSIELKNVKIVSDGFLKYNIDIEKFEMPKLKSIGKDYFLYNAPIRKNIVKSISEQYLLCKNNV